MQATERLYLFLLTHLRPKVGLTLNCFQGPGPKTYATKDIDSVPGLYEGSLKDLDFLKLPNSVFNK